jgi:hypothetical protein
VPTKPAIAVAGPRRPRQMPAIWSGVPNSGGVISSQTLAAGVPIITNRCTAGHGETKADALEWAGTVTWIKPGPDLKHGLSQAWQPLAIGLGSQHRSVAPKLSMQPLSPRRPHRHDGGCLHRPCGTHWSHAARLHAPPEASNWWTLVWARQPNLCRLHRGHSCVGRLYGSPAPAIVGPRWRGQGGLDLIVSEPPKPVKAGGHNPVGSPQDTFGWSAATSTAAQCDTCEARAGRHVQT